MGTVVYAGSGAGVPAASGGGAESGRIALGPGEHQPDTGFQAGLRGFSEPLPAGGSLEQAFGRRVSRLPPEARLLLAVAAAEPTGSQALLWRAAGELGIDPDAAASADLGGLAEIGSHVVFRHPLVRSVVYYAAPLRQRRRIHQAPAGHPAPSSRAPWPPSAPDWTNRAIALTSSPTAPSPAPLDLTGDRFPEGRQWP